MKSKGNAELRRNGSFLYGTSLALSVVNLVSLFQGSSSEVFFTAIWNSLVVVLFSAYGLIISKSEREEEMRITTLFNVLYLVLSIGLTLLLVVTSPRMLEKGLLIPSLVASIGFIAVSLFTLLRQWKSERRII